MNKISTVNESSLLRRTSLLRYQAKKLRFGQYNSIGQEPYFYIDILHMILLLHTTYYYHYCCTGSYKVASIASPVWF